MADEDLRALEVAASRGDVFSVLRFARALERAGRVDDAVDALLPHAGAGEVCTELVRLAPAPGRGTLDPGSESALRARPALAWKAPGSPAERILTLASPLGLVVSRSAVLQHEVEVTVHELATSRVRHRFTRAKHELFRTFGEAILLRGMSSQVATSIVTGKRLWELRACMLHAFSDGWLATRRETGPERCEVVLHRLDPRGHERPIEHARIAVEAPSAVVKGALTRDSLVVCIARRRLRTHTLTGELVQEEPGALEWSDADGVALTLLGPKRAVLRGTGDVIVDKPANSFPWAATARHVVFSTWGREGVVFDRTTGAIAGTLKADSSTGAILIGEDLLVLYDGPSWREAFDDLGHRDFDAAAAERAAEAAFQRSSLVAFTIAGEELWRIPAPEIATKPLGGLAAFRGRLYAASEDGTVACLVPP